MVSLVARPCNAISTGCWWNSTALRGSLNTTCDFYLVKWGIFSRSGYLQPLKAPSSPYIWVTHKLSAGEKFTVAQANQLAAALNKIKDVKQIELDIEPLPNADDVAVFLKNVRQKLSPNLSLRIATPFFSSQNWPGRSWKEVDFAKVIPHVNGIDLMIYDTGAKTESEYRSILEENLAAALRWMELNQSLEVTLGLPAYPDKTKRHNPASENLAVAKDVFAKNKAALPTRLSLAAYAGYTLTEDDAANLKEIKRVLNGR